MIPAYLENSKTGRLDYFGEFNNSEEFTMFDRLIDYFLSDVDWCVSNFHTANPSMDDVVHFLYEKYSSEEGSSLRKLGERISSFRQN